MAHPESFDQIKANAEQGEANMPRTMSQGRKTSYKSRYAEAAKKQRQNGMSLAGLAACFGVTRQTLYNWKASHEEFCEACKGERPTSRVELRGRPPKPTDPNKCGRRSKYSRRHADIASGMVRGGVSIRGIAKQLKVSRQTISCWRALHAEFDLAFTREMNSERSGIGGGDV